MTIWLVWEATLRIIVGSNVKGDIMFIVAVLGLLFNYIQMKILHSGDGHYHLGGGHEHHHHHSDASEDSHDHGHSHNHKYEHKHKHSHEKNRLKEELIDKEA